MASSFLLRLLLSFFICSILFITVQSDPDEEDTLLSGINSYRKSLNLTALSKNDNAECFAEELAEQFKSQPCTNTTGSFTVPGTQQPINNYERLLSECHLNVTTTQDGTIMPACVPNLDQTLVLGNFTGTQYSGFLNDSKYTGAGIASEGSWIVVVLTTSSPEGSFVTHSAANRITELGIISHLLFLLIGLLFLVVF